MTSTEAQAPRQGTTAPTPGRAGEGEAADYEETHVHGVYEAIASHFSATRHKPWPFVSSFLARQLPGSVGLDVGCGNGKNMGVNRDVLMFGCDRSAALISLARNMWCTGSSSQQKDDHQVQQGGLPPPAVLPVADATVADSLALPFRDGCADFVICIAVIHHMSTRERRVEAIRQLLRCIRRGKTQSSGQDNDSNNNSGGGQVLVYVWALEQSSSRRGWDQGGEQDLLVPWVMKAPQPPQEKQPKKEKKNKANKNNKQPRKQKMQQKQQQAGAAVETEAKDDDRNDDATTTNGTNGGSRILTSGGESSGSRDMQKQGQQEQSRGNHAENAARDGDDGEYETGVAIAATTGGKSSGTANTTNITRGGGGGGGGAEDVQVAPVIAAGAVVDATTDAAGTCTVTSNVPREEVEKESLCGGGGLPAETETAEKKEKKQQQQGFDRDIDEQQRQRQQEQHQQQLTDNNQAETQEKDKTFHRFYHLYRKGELEEDVLAAGGQVLESGYERDNWWVIAG